MTEAPWDVLLVFANPDGTERIRIGAEERLIRDAIRFGTYRDLIRIDTCQATDIHALRRALLAKAYRIIQFSGHSDGASLILENRDGDIHRVGFDLFASVLASQAPRPECVILNSCSTLERNNLLRLDVPFVVAMNGPIDDQAAIDFSQSFYESLAFGNDIESAFKSGCISASVHRHVSGQSRDDVPTLVKHSLLDKYWRQPLGVRTEEYDRWYEELRKGKLEIPIDPDATNEINVLLSIVDQVLRELAFDKATIDRTGIVLWELLSNVARHVALAPALLGVEINQRYLRSVMVSVADKGPGFDATSVIEEQHRRMKEGEPEHGLGRVFRVSDHIDHNNPSHSSFYHTIFATLYSLPEPQTAAIEFPWAARVVLVLESPYSVWLGAARYATWGTCGVVNTFNLALSGGIPQLLGLYFDHLLLSNPRYLCIETLGSREPTEAPPYAFPTITRALKTYFHKMFDRKSVVLLAGRDSRDAYKLMTFGEENDLPFFFSEHDFRTRMLEIETEMRPEQA